MVRASRGLAAPAASTTASDRMLPSDVVIPVTLAPSVVIAVMSVGR